MPYITEQQHSQWKLQLSIAQYLLLGTVIATVVNVLLLLANVDFYIPYSASLPYYLTYFGYYFDSWQVSTYTVTGMVMTFVCLAIYLVLWWMARQHIGWLWAGMFLLIADTLGLAVIVLLVMENPISFLLEFILHIVVVGEIAVGLRAYNRLRQVENQPSQWDPPSSEYSNVL